MIVLSGILFGERSETSGSVYLGTLFYLEHVVVNSDWRPYIVQRLSVCRSHYSDLSARIGSNRDAFHAGTRHASIATDRSVTVTPTKTRGSSG